MVKRLSFVSFECNDDKATKGFLFMDTYAK